MADEYLTEREKLKYFSARIISLLLILLFIGIPLLAITEIIKVYFDGLIMMVLIILSGLVVMFSLKWNKYILISKIFDVSLRMADKGVDRFLK